MRALGEKAVERVMLKPRPLVIPVIKRQREPHIRALRFNAKICKKRGKKRVIQLVVDDEAGIDRNRLAGMHDIDRGGMPADPQGP